MAVFWSLFSLNYLISFIIIIDMIIKQNKKPERIYAWMLTLLVLPFIGITIYLVIGLGLDFKTKRQIKERSISNKTYDEALKKQASELLFHENKNLAKSYAYVRDLALFNLQNSNAIYLLDKNRQKNLKICLN